MVFLLGTHYNGTKNHLHYQMVIMTVFQVIKHSNCQD